MSKVKSKCCCEAAESQSQNWKLDLTWTVKKNKTCSGIAPLSGWKRNALKEIRKIRNVLGRRQENPSTLKLHEKCKKKYKGHL